MFSAVLLWMKARPAQPAAFVAVAKEGGA